MSVIPEASTFKYVCSERALPGWKVSTPIKRSLLAPKGNVVGKYTQTHTEMKSKDVRKGLNLTLSVKPYDNPLLCPWQRELSKIINAGDNVIVTSVTSTGKTWATNLIVAHEVLERDNFTRALFISPNSEVMRSSAVDILKFHNKLYNHSGTVMSTMTRNYITYDLKRGPPGQIMIVAADSAIEFLTDPKNEEFVKCIKYVVFDEVHLKTMAEAMWWTQFIPHTAQLILLSATIGDPEDVKQIINRMQLLQKDRPLKTTIVSHHIRPIPLQLVMFKGCELPSIQIDETLNIISDEEESDDDASEAESSGISSDEDSTEEDSKPIEDDKVKPVKPVKDIKTFKSFKSFKPDVKGDLYTVKDVKMKGLIRKDLKGAGKLTCAISITDPTTRDLTSINPSLVIPEHREEQYTLGQSIITDNLQIVKKKNDEAFKDIKTESTPENILSLLVYLFSNEMQPALVFHTTTEQTRYAAEQIIGILNRIESQDEEFREAKRILERDAKQKQRARDNKVKKKSKGDKTNAKAMREWESGFPVEETIGKHDIESMRKKLKKWCFPTDIDTTTIPDNMDQWIRSCLDRGIGIYVATMPIWLRHYMFDAFHGGKIKVMFSDSTISVGINLPIRTCILCGHIPHHIYTQASGRAGRRGLDTKGFIVHLMPEDRIRKYIAAKSVDVSITMPDKMSYSGLINLRIPSNLDKEEKPTAGVPSEEISKYKKQILINYMSTLSEEDQEVVSQQLTRMDEESWTYHRLTHFIKTLPLSESCLIIKLLTTGILHQFEAVEFIDLLALLFYRCEIPEDLSEEQQKKYYIPEFKRFPDLIDNLKDYAELYCIDIDFDKPIHHYFNQFCLSGRQYLKYMEHLQDMGEWLYNCKRGLTDIAPTDHQNKPIDEFVKLVHKVDSVYLSAVTRKKVLDESD
jgi:hypothetical protein